MHSVPVVHSLLRISLVKGKHNSWLVQRYKLSRYTPCTAIYHVHSPNTFESELELNVPMVVDRTGSLGYFDYCIFRFDKCLKRGMKRECILSENELNKKRKIIQRNKIKKILNEAEQLTSEELSKLDHGNQSFYTLS